LSHSLHNSASALEWRIPSDVLNDADLDRSSRCCKQFALFPAPNRTAQSALSAKYRDRQKMGKRVKSLGLGMICAAGFGLVAMCLGAGHAAANEDKSPLPDPVRHKAAQDGKKFEDGRWVLPDGSPTYDVERGAENTDIVVKVDWMTYSGWRRYHAECHVCHGPNAEGSSFAPALKDSLKTMDYSKFLQIVSSGQVRDVAGTKYIMPALGDNKNVMCYVDDLYVYLRARSTDALPGGRISADQRADKPKEAIESEKACLGD
jgi:methanol metabolism-related c-type cytochrome